MKRAGSVLKPGADQMRNSQIKGTKPGFLLLGSLGQIKNIKRGQSTQGMREDIGRGISMGKAGLTLTCTSLRGKERGVSSLICVHKVISGSA